MKNKLILIISILFIIPFILTVKSMAAEPTYTQEQKAIREIADAYYQRGINAQYSPERSSRVFSPEEATSQNTTYSMCSGYAFSIYYQAFGIKLPIATSKLISYANEYYNPNNIKTNDVIEYWQKTTDESGNVVYKDNNGNVKTIDLSTDNGRQRYAKYLLENCNLQVGDIICWLTSKTSGGHTMIVYDIIYDENNKPVDAIIRDATSKWDQKTTKITNGLSYWDQYNEKNDIHEGVYKEWSLVNSYQTNSETTRASILNECNKKPNFAIIRPLLKDQNGNYTGKYYFSKMTYNSDAEPAGYIVNQRTETEYEITNSILKRMNYSKMYIEKTVDVFNNSVVNLGDTLEYTIKIKNNSNKRYSGFEVIENIPQYVEIVDNGDGIAENNKLKWNISGLDAKQSIEIKYKVKVKSKVSYLKKEIVSTGSVAGISSSTVKNVIGSNLKQTQKSEIKNTAQSLLNSNQYNGKQLISKIYIDSLGAYTKINILDITNLINKKTSELNNQNEFYNMVMGKYYGALNSKNVSDIKLIGWIKSSIANDIDAEDEVRSKRADTIYKENFQTGDILVYKNTQTASGNVTYKTEDGVYYLIYIDEADKITIGNEEVYGFVGINDNGEINHIGTDRTSLQTLLGKDYYVVLRPSMSIDIVPMNLGISYSTTQFTNGGVKVTITSNEEMLPVSGWTLSSNKKKLTKTFTKNIDKEYPIYDLGGNKVTVKIKIDNIVEKLGDINKDGKVNIADLIGVIRHIGSKEGSKYYLDEEKRFIADINQDGKVNIADVIGIIRLISTSK